MHTGNPKKSKPNPGQTSVLTVDELSVHLRLDRKAVYEAIRRGEIPAVRIGRCIRISREAFATWLAGAGSAQAARPRTS